jgi:hypothetical protein
MECGVESTWRGDARKDRCTVGSKAGTEEIGGALKTRGDSLSETPTAIPTQSAKQPTNQTKRKKIKKKKGEREWGEAPHKG